MTRCKFTVPDAPSLLLLPLWFCCRAASECTRLRTPSCFANSAARSATAPAEQRACAQFDIAHCGKQLNANRWRPNLTALHLTCQKKELGLYSCGVTCHFNTKECQLRSDKVPLWKFYGAITYQTELSVSTVREE